MKTHTPIKTCSVTFHRGASAVAKIGCVALAIFLFTPNPASSATLTWDNGAATGNWATDANWTGSIWNSSTPDDAVFGATGVGSVSVNAAIKAKSVTAQTAGYTIANGGGTLQVNGAFTNTADLTLSAFLAGSLTNASGNLIIAALETNTGFTVINGGTLSIATGSGLYNGPSAVTTAGLIRINSGGTLSMSGPLGNAAGVALGRAQPSTNCFFINGGTWQHTGGNAKTIAGAGRLFTINALGATLDSVTPGSEFSVGYRYDFSAPGVIGGGFGGSLTLSGAGNGDLNYLLQGTGGLIKKGAGIWKLSNVNTYSGPTVIMTGTLALANGTSVLSGQGNGSLTSPSITISNGATFDVSLATGGFTLTSGQSLLGDGTISGAVNTTSGTKIYGGLDGTYGTNTFTGNLTLVAGALCYLDLGTSATGANDSLVVGGDLVLNSTVFHLKAPGTLASLATGTDYVLISVAGTITGSPNAAPVWDVAPVNAANFQVLVIGNNVVLREVAGTPPSAIGSAAPGKVYHFDPTTVSVIVTPGTSPINSVLVNAVSIGGGAAVPLMAAGGNVYTNTVVVGAAAAIGTNTLLVTVTDTALLSAGANIPVVVVGTNRTWNGAGPDGNWSTQPNWLGGAGPGFFGDSVTFAGETNLAPVMDGNYSVTGLTFDGTAGGFTFSMAGYSLTLAGGGVTNNSTNSQTLDIPVVLTGQQTFDTAMGDVTVGQAVSGSASLIKTGNSNLTLAANAAYDGPTTIHGGTLTVGSKLYVTAANVDGPVTINSGGVLSLPSGGISLNGSLGKLKMPATSMVINGGVLRHTGTGNLQTSGEAARLFTIGALGATLDSATAGETFSLGFRYDFIPVLVSTAGGRLTLSGEGNGHLDYSLPGSGGLTKSGPGTWTMSGSNNTYSGSTFIQEGTLNFNQPVISIFTTVIMQTNTVLNLNFAETNAIGGLVLDGVSMPPGVYDATTSAPYIQGTGSLLVRTGPSASFTMAPTSGVSTLTVNFTNTSSGTPLSSALWTFGDGGVSTATNTAPLAVTYKYTNLTCTVTTNFVVLTVDNGAGNSTWTNPTPVVVYPAAPIASFGVDNTNVAAATTVTFTNLAGGCVATALWSFGDGTYSTSTDFTVTHAYSNAGTNPVTLAVTNAYGFGTISSVKSVVVTNQSSVVGIPRITVIKYQNGTNVLLMGTNVASGIHDYYVLATTNVAQPRYGWQSLVTNQCNADGSFSNNLPVNGAKQFYLIQVPQP